MADRKLTFEPTIFRDWSIAYCELAYILSTKEFKKQFGWRYSIKNYLNLRGWELVKYKPARGIDFIKGISVYNPKRLIRGKLKIVQNKEELSKVNEGDIIVGCAYDYFRIWAYF